jgi:hypothetical protein
MNPTFKLRTRKFGAKPVSDYVTVPVVGREHEVDPQTRFELHWEDAQMGLAAEVRELENGRLIAEVFCGDAGLLGKAAVCVGLAGKAADHVINKVILLNAPVGNGCGGTADFGLLADAVKELGTQIAVIVFLNLNKS